MKFEISIGLNFIISHLYDKLPRRRVNMLAEQMYKHLNAKFRDHWYPEIPSKGSAYRSIRICRDKIDRALINASVDVSLDLHEILDSLPKDLTVWIDPGEVSYRIGEKGSINILYSNQRYWTRRDEIILTNENTPQHEFIPTKSSTRNMQQAQTADYRIATSSPVIPSWSNSTVTPLLPIQTFAQTRFGSLKVKHTERAITKRHR